jgi:protein ImuB
MRRVISLWFPALAVDRLRREQAQGWRDEPLALVRESAGRVIVTALNDAALAAGLHPDMALADARAIVPALATVPADPAADAAFLARLAAWCGRYTPWTAPEGGDGVWLDVTGCAHLFGGELDMTQDLLSRLAGFGLTARAALADTPGAAWALSHYGDGTGKMAGRVVPPGGTERALADLPAAALRLGPAAVAGLTRVGLKRIGDLYDKPRAPVTLRFGDEVMLRLGQALGRIAEPVSPRRPPPRFRVRLAFADPIGLPDDIAAALQRLLHRLCEQLDRQQQGCRRLELTLYRVDGSVQSTAVGTASPAREADHLARLFAERLGHLDPGFGVEAVTLAAPVTEPLAPAQVAAPDTPARTRRRKGAALASGIGPSRDPALGPLLDRLGNRLGFDRLTTLQPFESHLPEGASRPVPVSAPLPQTLPGWRPGAPRPLRLLDRPELLETVAPVAGAAQISEEPPAAFRWRRVQHRLRAAEGPERISPEWWRPENSWAGGTRDYWRVEDEDGRRFWLFREAKPRRDGAPRWFLHGLFA